MEKEINEEELRRSLSTKSRSIDDDFFQGLKQAIFGILETGDYINLNTVQRNREIMKDISSIVAILSKRQFNQRFQNLNFKYKSELKFSNKLVKNP